MKATIRTDPKLFDRVGKLPSRSLAIHPATRTGSLRTDGSKMTKPPHRARSRRKA